MRRKAARHVTLRVEELESRLVPSTVSGLSDLEAPDFGPFQKVIVAGSSTATPPDSPSNRVDPNTTTSPFAGVGSINISTRRGSYICTGAAISPTHVLTAAHCVDINDDGRSDSRDGIRHITFYLNYGSNLSHSIRASTWQVFPNYTGFDRPSLNDDLAVLTLARALPAGVPIYELYTGALDQPLTLVGYGQSGDGVRGYSGRASYSVKRVGENVADAYYGQDDAGKPATREVFRYDFDGPTGNGSMGGPTLGNTRETTLGGGDSGGPAFIRVGSEYQVAGVNTFTQGRDPKFGSLGGGMVVAAYASWIQSVKDGSAAAAGSPGSSSGGHSGTVRVIGGLMLESTGSPRASAIVTFLASSPAAKSTPSSRSTPDVGLAASIYTLQATAVNEDTPEDIRPLIARLDHEKTDQLLEAIDDFDLKWGWTLL